MNGRRSRKTPEPYWLYGRHAVCAALANPSRTLRRVVVAKGIEMAELPVDPGDVEIRDRRELDALTGGDAVHQGIAALAEPLDRPGLEAAARTEGRRNFVLVLDQVTDPRNVGAILRAAAAFEARAVIMQDRHAPPETGALAKAASGALDIVPVVRAVNLARALDELAAMDYWRIGLAHDAPQSLREADLDADTALVLGAEGTGLRRLTREHCDLLARIPISAKIDSLNISAAAAIALYALGGK